VKRLCEHKNKKQEFKEKPCARSVKKAKKQK